jgi:hypothetical protein
VKKKNIGILDGYHRNEMYESEKRALFKLILTKIPTTSEFDNLRLACSFEYFNFFELCKNFNLMATDIDAIFVNFEEVVQAKNVTALDYINLITAFVNGRSMLWIDLYSYFIDPKTALINKMKQELKMLKLPFIDEFIENKPAKEFKPKTQDFVKGIRAYKLIAGIDPAIEMTDAELFDAFIKNCFKRQYRTADTTDATMFAKLDEIVKIDNVGNIDREKTALNEKIHNDIVAATPVPAVMSAIKVTETKLLLPNQVNI